MIFKIGQKVVLVDASGWDAHDYILWDYPKQGDVYTIREIVPIAELGFNCLRLEEIRNEPARSREIGELMEPCFRASRFRPLAEKKTDISIFTAMLHEARTPALTSAQPRDA